MLLQRCRGALLGKVAQCRSRHASMERSSQLLLLVCPSDPRISTRGPCVASLRSVHDSDALTSTTSDFSSVRLSSETISDGLQDLLQVLPEDIRHLLWTHPERHNLVEVVMDLGRKPEARFAGKEGGLPLRDREITAEELLAAESMVGQFGNDNRAGLPGTLHRISAIRSRRGCVVGLTCRVGRAVSGHADMFRDLLEGNRSVLFLGKPGVGKTTAIRELARVLSDDIRKRVVIVDTSNEIGGDGDVPHPAIGSARRMQVPDANKQHHIMVEAVENHMPQVVIVDEISTEAEALACRSIAERGVQLIGTAHGILLENLIRNPALNELVGGVQSVTLGDEEARQRGSQKTVQERGSPATFQVVVEMRQRNFWVVHETQQSVDAILTSKEPQVQVRKRDSDTNEVTKYSCGYSKVDVVPGRVVVDDANKGTPALANNILAWAQKHRDSSDLDTLQAISRLGLNNRKPFATKIAAVPAYAAASKSKLAAKVRARKQ